MHMCGGYHRKMLSSLTLGTSMGLGDPTTPAVSPYLMLSSLALGFIMRASGVLEVAKLSRNTGGSWAIAGRSVPLSQASANYLSRTKQLQGAFYLYQRMCWSFLMPGQRLADSTILARQSITSQYLGCLEIRDRRKLVVPQSPWVSA